MHARGRMGWGCGRRPRLIARTSARLMSEPDVFSHFHFEQSFHSSCGRAGNFLSQSFHSSCGGAGNFFLYSGHPALRRFAASCAVRTAPAAQCSCKERSYQERKHVGLRSRFHVLQISKDTNGSSPRGRGAEPALPSSDTVDKDSTHGPMECEKHALMGRYAASIETQLGSAQPLRICVRKIWGATQRAFFLGDFFLYTSKERSHPLGRRPSGSSNSESYPLLRKRSGSF